MRRAKLQQRKLNRQKKQEKDRKAKEERKRLGLPEPGAEFSPGHVSEDGGRCNEVNHGQPMTPPPFTIYEDVDAEGDSKTSGNAKEVVRKAFGPAGIPNPESPCSAELQLGRTAHSPGHQQDYSLQPTTPIKTTTNGPDIGDDGDSKIGQDLANNQNPFTNSTTRLLNIPKEDLASGKGNLNPTEELPNKKSPDRNMPTSSQSNKTKRRHDDAFLDDEDKENDKPRTKQVCRSLLGEFANITPLASQNEYDELQDNLERVLPDDEDKKPGTKRVCRSHPRTPLLELPLAPSQDEDGDGLEEELIRAVERAARVIAPKWPSSALRDRRTARRSSTKSYEDLLREALTGGCTTRFGRY
jgi:hypothetical protein